MQQYCIKYYKNPKNHHKKIFKQLFKAKIFKFNFLYFLSSCPVVSRRAWTRGVQNSQLSRWGRSVGSGQYAEIQIKRTEATQTFKRVRALNVFFINTYTNDNPTEMFQYIRFERLWWIGWIRFKNHFVENIYCTYPQAVLWIQIRIYPHHFSNLDPHTHQIKIRIWIHIRFLIKIY